MSEKQTELNISRDGMAGRITLERPDALNALTPTMCDAISAALGSWAKDDAISLLIIDAEGDKAFCAGGDIAQVYAEGVAGNAGFAQEFWRREYHMNAALFHFPKPVVTFLHGYTMGGGVGVGCHGSHRIVDHSSRVALPECAIGLVTDVGGTLLLARAPGRLGEYLAATAFRMGPQDAIYAGFADYLIPRKTWPDLIAALSQTGDLDLIDASALPTDDAPLKVLQPQIDAHFAGTTLRDILNALDHSDAPDFAAQTLAFMEKNDPLAMTASVELVQRARGVDTIEAALEQEFRFTYRAVKDADILEGIRARIIDRDSAPNWSHTLRDVPALTVSTLLRPLGKDGLWAQESTPQ
ncbi:enoyl-CoA hydratase/isomerase family protein [Celeribacter sp.]|uniref:enoyl-CoA hydratase/isomerase family protein n=1 Tax=Celeribacter sp. TaxID=1890673 RepID=UPI003A8E7B3C